MKRLAHASLLIPLLIACAAHSHAQKLTASYDKFKDQTLVYTENVHLANCENSPLHADMVAIAVFRGQGTSALAKIVLQFVLDSKDGGHGSESDIIILADDQRMVFDQVAWEASVKHYQDREGAILGTSGITYIRELLATNIPYEQFMKMANAKKVEMLIGRTEANPLGGEQLLGLRALADRIPSPEVKAVATPALVPAKPAAKPTRPARRSSRRRP